MTTDYHTYRAIITGTVQQVPGTFLTVPDTEAFQALRDTLKPPLHAVAS